MLRNIIMNQLKPSVAQCEFLGLNAKFSDHCTNEWTPLKTAKLTSQAVDECYLLLENTALDRGRTGRISLTYDLNHDLWRRPSVSCDLWSWSTNVLVQKFKVNGQSVQKTEWKQSDDRANRRTEAIALPHSLMQSVKCCCRGWVELSAFCYWPPYCMSVFSERLQFRVNVYEINSHMHPLNRSFSHAA